MERALHRSEQALAAALQDAHRAPEVRVTAQSGDCAPRSWTLVIKFAHTGLLACFQTSSISRHKSGLAKNNPGSPSVTGWGSDGRSLRLMDEE
jgi:hypothetical protein